MYKIFLGTVPCQTYPFFLHWLPFSPHFLLSILLSAPSQLETNDSLTWIILSLVLIVPAYVHSAVLNLSCDLFYKEEKGRHFCLPGIAPIAQKVISLFKSP